jgi:hypothetical protein
MEKSAVASHKSHMSCATRLAARSLHDTGEWQAAPTGHGAEAPCAGAADDAGSDASGSPACCLPPATATVTRWAFMAACRVDESALPVARAWRPGRTAPGTAGTPHTVGAAHMSGRAHGPGTAQTATMPGTATPGETTDRRQALTRGGGIPRPSRGARWGARQAASAANHRQLGKGQRAYFTADGTAVKAAARPSRLSRGESLIHAQDLQSATLSDLISTKSNIFKFVMT